MRERPILFSGPMVRALLAGSKMQTRRVVKPQPLACDHKEFKGRIPPTEFYDTGGNEWACKTCGNGVCSRGQTRAGGFHCPYGVPGDRLWVRETLNVIDWDSSEARLGACVQYAADGQVRGWTHNEDEKHSVSMDWGKAGKGIPSIFMPRWASRITLEITSVRVERVQSISEEDALAEGIEAFDFPVPPDPPGQVQRMYGTTGYFPQTEVTARKAYRRLWQEINGKREGFTWADNPWVWALTFRRVDSQSGVAA